MKAVESFLSVMIDAAFALLLWGGVLFMFVLLLPIVLSMCSLLGIPVPAALDIF